MPKRKKSKEEEVVDTNNLLRKLRRLERKIHKHRSPFPVNSKSSSRTSDSPDDEPEETSVDPIIITEEFRPDESTKQSAETAVVGETPPTQPQTEDNVEHDILDDKIIKILGKSYEKPPEMGHKIHNSIAERWEAIIQNGLEKEEKENILKSTHFLPPENCPHLIVPKMNPETLAACAEANKKRDNIIESRQKLISKCISGLAYATEKVIKEVNPQELKLNLLEIMNNTGKILADVYYNENKTRRSLVVSELDKDMRDTLLQTKPDKFLFGDNLYEKIKTAKSVGKTGREIRPQPKTKPNLSKGSLNWKGPPRPTQKPLPQESRVIKNRNGGPRQAPVKRAPPAATRMPRKQTSSSNNHPQRN